MEDIKLACISCHIVIFSFGVFLLIIFGIFTVCDFDEFQYKEIASNHSKGITALIYWIPAMLHLAGTVGLIIWKKKLTRSSNPNLFIKNNKVNEEIILQEVIRETIPQDEMISLPSQDNNSKGKIESIN